MTRLRRLTCVSSAVLGLVLVGCGDDAAPIDNPDSDFADETVVRATVEQVLRDPENFSDNPIRVTGDAYRVRDLGFMLVDDGKAIFVGAPASRLGKVDQGETITVRGELSQIDDTQAESIRDALDQQPEAIELPANVRPIDVGPDKPFLNLRALSGEGAGEQPAAAP